MKEKEDNTFSFSALVEKKRLTGVDFNPVSAPPEHANSAAPVALSRAGEESALAHPGTALMEQEGGGRKFQLPFDPFRIADALWRHKIPCVVAALVLGGLGYVAASFLLKPSYASNSVLLRQELPDTFRASEIGQPYKPLDISIPVLIGSVMKSGYLLDRVCAQTNPRLHPEDILNRLEINTEKNTGTVRIGYKSKISAEQAAKVLNIYTIEVVKMTKELESGDANSINELLKAQIARCDADLVAADNELLKYSKEANLVDADKEITSYLSELSNMDLKMHEVRLDYETLDVKISSVEKELGKLSSAAAALQKAKGELAQLLTRYTEQNPVVMTQMDTVKALEEEIKNNEASGTQYIEPGGNPIAEGLYLNRVEMLSQKAMLGQQLQKFDKLRSGITDKLNELPRKNLEYALIKSKRGSLEKARELLSGRQREANLYVQNPLGRYRILNGPRTEDVKVDDRGSLKASVLLAGLAGGFFLVGGFITLRELADRRIETSADLARTTGLPVLVTLPEDIGEDPDAQRAWGLRAWTDLRSSLGAGDRALVCGLLAEKDGDTHLLSKVLSEAACFRDCAVLLVSSHAPENGPTVSVADALGSSRTSADNWLAHESGIIHVQVPEDWQWNAEQRGLLHNSLALWSRHPHAVIFIDLPSMTKSETLLLAEKLPMVLWVGKGGQKPDHHLGETLSTYRKAGCRVLGAMMSGVPRLRPTILNQFASSLSVLAVMMALTFTHPAHAESSVSPLASAPGLESPSPANTQKKLPPVKLAPGDSVNLNMFGRLGCDRNEVFIQPDGNLTYLQATIKATGLTLDEIRAKLNETLAQYHQNPRVIITPDRFQSRKVYILGKVVKKGMVNYDRPLSLLEAVTEAGGLEIGLFEQNTVEMADLGRSFLSRGGTRMNVDFRALFYRGDMSQNVMLQPDDYIYFPSANSNEVYILGNVANQGTQGLLGHSSVTSVIAQAGGFTPKAFKDRVLLVRGGLDKPETFVVNMRDVLAGKDKGVRLEPKDIIFVADKPWARAEELLEMALSAFVQGATTGWVAGNVAPVIVQPWLEPSIQSNR